MAAELVAGYLATWVHGIHDLRASFVGQRKDAPISISSTMLPFIPDKSHVQYGTLIYVYYIIPNPPLETMNIL